MLRAEWFYCGSYGLVMAAFVGGRMVMELSCVGERVIGKEY